MSWNKSKFVVGQKVKIKSYPSHIGTVLLIDITEQRKYLLECSPGALPNYIYIWVNNINGIIKFCAANWFFEDELKE